MTAGNAGDDQEARLESCRGNSCAPNSDAGADRLDVDALEFVGQLVALGIGLDFGVIEVVRGRDVVVGQHVLGRIGLLI
jgi:hypothetical protein